MWGTFPTPKIIIGGGVKTKEWGKFLDLPPSDDSDYFLGFRNFVHCTTLNEVFNINQSVLLDFQNTPHQVWRSGKYNVRHPLKEGVHQFYKFVLKCKVRYTITAIICDFPQICFYTARQLFWFPGTGSPGTQSWFSGTQSRFSGNTI